MNDPIQALKDLKPTQEFFIGIDSDGCVFDTMEIKHKECFTPMFIKHFHLQAASKYAREVWDFVNLYSKTRGTNRFPALVRSLQLLAARPQVRARGVRIWDAAPLEAWIERESKLGNVALKQEVASGNHGARTGAGLVHRRQPGHRGSSSKACRRSRFSGKAWPG
jgi:hypothetical protein